MAKYKLSQTQQAELRKAYESWNPHDPDSESADELAARFGISKQTLYTLRKKWLDDDKAARPTGELLERVREQEAVIRYLTEELVAAKHRVSELEARLRAEAGVDDPGLVAQATAEGRSASM
jgi:transposase-like protein